ncbi:GlsB/YeaQ/YmgE family stress response membrane protein [Cryptosporangium sp. NPDC048952]|uniref:GlsB/YeaQ/YmgE family stress response membrane protein n=1 Tax=Cryptosporangium sp. NPDC048952 TaxID=3363961 RepID=UPI003716B3F0
MNELERRYRRLLLAYPADYRAERGDEIVDTYLDTVEPGRTRPSARDAVDLLAGGARQHLRARGASGLPGAVSIAAVLALATGSMLATIWLLAIEFTPVLDDYDLSGPAWTFQTFAAFAWIAWLAAAIAFAVASGRWCRRLIAASLVLMVAAKPVGLLATALWAPNGWFSISMPSFIALVPHAALGVLALAVPSRPGRVTRWVPVLAAVVPIVPVLRLDLAYYWSYNWVAPSVFAVVAPLLLFTANAVGAWLMARRDRRGLWIGVVTLPSVALLSAEPLIQVAARLDTNLAVGLPFWLERSTVSALLTVVTLGILGLAFAVTKPRRTGSDGSFPPAARPSRSAG